MSEGAIVRRLTHCDTSYRGLIVLPSGSTEEHIISRMDEDLKRRVTELGHVLEVTLENMDAQESKIVGFRATNAGFAFSRCANAVRWWYSNAGDKVEFKLRDIVGESLIVEFRKIPEDLM